VSAIRWAALVSAGVLLWMFGLLALDVPADLPHWRHIAGAVLMVCAVHSWRRASITDNQPETGKE
jgi:hypothetical protein